MQVFFGQKCFCLHLIRVDRILRENLQKIVELSFQKICTELLYRIDYYLRRQLLFGQYLRDLIFEFGKEAVLLGTLISFTVEKDHTFTPLRISAAPAAHVLMSSGATRPTISR